MRIHILYMYLLKETLKDTRKPRKLKRKEGMGKPE
jgi:hypothetical protein